jgi:phage terminase large subunit
MGVVGWVINEVGGDKTVEICVDSIGLGAGVADRLREQGYNVRDVNVAESSPLNPQAFKLRDELWLSVKDWLNTRACKLPKSDELRLELTACGYGYASNGKVKVESKADMKSRLRMSPDLADALCLTFAGQAAMIGGRAIAWSPGKPLLRNLRGIV